jgi:hypothetical protein
MTGKCREAGKLCDLPAQDIKANGVYVHVTIEPN